MTVATNQRTGSLAEPPSDTAPPTTQVVAELERELDSSRRRRVWQVGLAAALLVGGALGLDRYRKWRAPPAPSPFVTAAVEVRNIVESVESSGKLKPLTEVKVGTQVSGRVVRVHVDFNRVVKQGDLLAEIDPSLFLAQVGQVTGQRSSAEAQLERARAIEQTARVTLERARQLKIEGLSSQADLDQAETSIKLAQADAGAASALIKALSAQLASAGTTLAYTKIYSPIDGIVIDRAVDPGQTVASNFAAPVLFVIARDLSEMQVLADIDEADVGKVREQMAAVVRVDAFPEQSFAGKVTQIRYNPTEVQGVVTYAAVVEVRNDELKLRPGMTATVTITTSAVQQVKAARNAALRFKPKDATTAAVSPALRPGERRVYVLPPAASTTPAGPPKPSALLVPIGISDGVWTELKSSRPALGARLVTEEKGAAKEERRKFLGIL